MASIAAIIPTFGRATLLDRTLSSLSTCPRPANLKTIIVAENGPKCNAEDSVQRFRGILPVEYHYTEKANKSFALNEVLKGKPADFLIFFDDDIRAELNIFNAYARAVEGQTGGFFLGGKVNIDYEEEPPNWLKKYLPPSAVGWDLGPQKCPIGGPLAIGMNWGAFAADIERAGGFDPRFGPGTGARGQETTMQKSLIKVGVEGIFIPDAIVWHYVPKDRCSPEWALDRNRQVATRIGVDLRAASKLGQLRRLPKLYVKRFLLRRRVDGANGGGFSKERFEQMHALKWCEGVLEGYRRGETNAKA